MTKDRIRFSKHKPPCPQFQFFVLQSADRERRIMIRLGTFTRTTNGFFGQITTFLMEDDLSILPIEDPATENTPDYCVLRGLEDDAAQVGCAWARQGERIGLWLAVMIDDPLFARPLRARLLPDRDEHDTFHLVWNRPRTPS
ncbi:DUF736 domain-containing protein [Acetobacter senegalensis]|uniref:DUF736 domain-containing protein n=1 Tax=Acetobacter senegalensis TaxID=446692 RepID=UPI00264C746E|nr:DUF736 domain-containing protein [Acetobacter senegalensis]MDN7353313.1 DUF736 domain-containing protein [Acetobacter senegalensis]